MGRTTCVLGAVELLILGKFAAAHGPRRWVRLLSQPTKQVRTVRDGVRVAQPTFSKRRPDPDVHHLLDNTNDMIIYPSDSLTTSRRDIPPLKQKRL